jgi:TPR repeat protein
LQAAAQFDLGVIHEQGDGIPKNQKEAVRWYSLSADQGHVQAQLSLARIYYEGAGVKKDPVETYKWIYIAGVIGGDAAGLKPMKDKVAKELSEKQLEEARQRSRDWLTNFTK